MKRRNQFLKYKMFANQDGGAGGGGGAGGDAGAGGAGGSQAGDENNTGNNVAPFDDIWNTPSSGIATDDQSQNNQNGVQNGQQQSAEDLFNAHIGNLGFGNNANDLMSAFQNQDAEAFQNGIRQMQADVYRASMLDVNRLVESRVNAALEEMRSTTKNEIQTGTVISQMESQLPFTKSPAYAPIAKAVLNNLLAQEGMTPEKAVTKVGEYFKALSNDISGNAGAPNGKPNGGFQNGNSQQSSQEQNKKQEDWVSFLTGGSQTSET